MARAKKTSKCRGFQLRPNLERGIIICLLLILILLIIEDRRYYRHHYGKHSKSNPDTIRQKDVVGVDEPGRNRNSENYQEPDRKVENDREDEKSPPETEVNDKGDADVSDKTSLANATATFSTGNSSAIDVEMERILAERQKHLTEACRRRNQFGLKWPRTPANVLVSDKMKAIYCMVGKVASSTWKKVFLAASGRMDPKRMNESQHLKLGARALHALVPLQNVGGELRTRRLETYFRFAFVRHPIDRLTSAYLEKFRLLPRNIRPLARRIIRRYRPNATEEEKSTGQGVTFAEFVRYLIDSGRFQNDVHWTPQSKLCLPCSMHYHVIGRYENMWRDADYVLKRLGVPAGTVSFPRWAKPRPIGSRYEDLLATVPERYRISLRKFYAQDYEMFGYT